jgi:hypothetical protein
MANSSCSGFTRECAGPDRALIPDTLKLALLQHAPQFQLQEWTHVAHLIEEAHTLMGGLKRADLIPHGTGEGAPDMSEQLSFEERIGDG